MTLPKIIKVAGVDYTVSEVENVIIEGSTEYGGSCDYATMEIEIRESLPQARKDEVFIHELLHAMFYEAGYQEHDEDMVIRVGKVMHQVLKDNPNLLKPAENVIHVIDTSKLTKEDLERIKAEPINTWGG